ncbi:MAG: formylglycine-generating enzyme family protein [Bacteroidetes bacterium]|nr:formylglycine-generating enzyme family protein [Bacteroidota bacterium]
MKYLYIFFLFNLFVICQPRGYDFLEINHSNEPYKYGRSNSFSEINQNSLIKNLVVSTMIAGETEKLSESFNIGITEVSIRQYQEFLLDLAELIDSNSFMTSLESRGNTFQSNKQIKNFLDVFIRNVGDTIMIGETYYTISHSPGKKQSKESPPILGISFFNESGKNYLSLDGFQTGGEFNTTSDGKRFLEEAKDILWNASQDTSQYRKNELLLWLYLLPYDPDDGDRTQLLRTFYSNTIEDDQDDLDLPVSGIDWASAMIFALFYDCSLPTDLEHETACRHRKNKEFREDVDYPWDGDVLGEYDPVCKKTFKASFSRKKKLNFVEDDTFLQDNELYHLAGNVSEWIYNDYTKDLDIIYAQRNDLNFHTDLLKAFKVTRGGSYKDALYFLRNDIRLKISALHRDITIGFRIVK